MKGVGRLRCVLVLSNPDPEYVKALHEMFVLDAVICNTDRHFGNFGFLIDNRTNTLAAPAPLFDHGASKTSEADRKTDSREGGEAAGKVRAPSSAHELIL